MGGAECELSMKDVAAERELRARLSLVGLVSFPGLVPGADQLDAFTRADFYIFPEVIKIFWKATKSPGGLSRAICGHSTGPGIRGTILVLMKCKKIHSKSNTPNP
jgi:hypothetical protein